MTYTQLGILAVVGVLAVDLWVLRTRMVLRKAFWTAYAIIFGFQMLTNGVLTGFRIVTYDPDVIVGGEPRLLGDGRLFFAPVEDVLFGFAMVTLTMATWIWLGRRGIDR